MDKSQYSNKTLKAYDDAAAFLTAGNTLKSSGASKSNSKGSGGIYEDTETSPGVIEALGSQE